MIILIHPPVAKPCEPPAGIAKLAGILIQNGIPCKMVDANLEGLLWMIGTNPQTQDTWTDRAVRNRKANLDSLRGWPLYANMDRYRRAVSDLNRIIETSCLSSALRISLANYRHRQLSPVRSGDLLKAAQRPWENPFFPYYRNRLAELMDKERPSHVGISLNFLNQALCAFAMIGYLRKEFPEIKLILGGGLVTSWMRKPGWKNPFEGLVHYMVEGPGELSLFSILGADVKPHLRTTPLYNSLPLADYLSPGPILPYSTSNGCYWNRCAFCPERAEGNPYDPIPQEQVLLDLNELVTKSKPTLIHLLDNALSPSLMKCLVQHPPGAPWYGFARITRQLADADFCRALKRSGCVMLKLGLESGDQGVLDRENKGIELEVASKALINLRKSGVATYVYLLFGTPSETLVEARKTLRFIVKHADVISHLNLAIFNLPVYGPDTRGLETRELYEGDLSLYTGFVHPKGWERGLVRRFVEQEFKKHQAVSDILRRDPPLFTSNHAPFFCRDDKQLLHRAKNV